MKKRGRWYCDSCRKILSDKAQIPGYVIHGNVTVAAEAGNGGLIGNNFPFPPGSEELIKVRDVRKTTFCPKCLAKALYFWEAMVDA